ncbi:hypothetical protein [Bradyrhizobium genosp. P]|uniref:hypothetical protein n=1 Tax=Bradyrhizobium genosp. P TaxID=83641 RepID=UPI003CF3DECA
MPILNYVSQNSTTVNVSYADMPVGADVVFVDKTSGKTTAPVNDNAIAAGGNGQAAIEIPGLTNGDYCLLAQKAGTFLAQTVTFALA